MGSARKSLLHNLVNLSITKFTNLTSLYVILNSISYYNIMQIDLKIIGGCS